MKLKLTALTEEEQHHKWELSSPWLQELFLADVAHDAVESQLYKPHGSMNLQVWVYRNEKEAFFRARLEGKIQSLCVRCLEELPFPVTLTFDGLFVPNQEHLTEESEDPCCYYHDGDSIDFTQPVRENIFLHLPFSPSCLTLEVPCIGTPLHTEEESSASAENSKPIDPRWAALAQIKSSLPHKK